MTLLTYFDKKYNVKEIFDTKTGVYVGSDVLDENGKETGRDPFMRSFPLLLDVGIMGTCSSVSSCWVGCYQQGGGNKVGKNMSLEFFKNIIDQLEGKTFSVALGGFGNPNEHPDFIEIVKYAYEHNVIPNYTTAGTKLTIEQIQATKLYCGAVAISWHRQPYTYSAIRRFLDAGMKTNIHYVLGNDSIDEAIERLEDDDFPEGINAVMFLLYKPVGKVKQNNVLSPSDPRVKKFYSLIEEKHPFKCGLDSCHVPGLINNTTKVMEQGISSCDAARFSMYVTPDGFALPCSFDTTNRNWAVDLKDKSIQNVWDGEVFSKFRLYHGNSCKGCSLVERCKGGCALMGDKINLCDREERDYYEQV